MNEKDYDWLCHIASPLHIYCRLVEEWISKELIELFLIDYDNFYRQATKKYKTLYINMNNGNDVLEKQKNKG